MLDDAVNVVLGLVGFWLVARALSHPSINAYTDRDTVKLDCDNVKLSEVKKWTRRACKFYGLSGYLILEPSKDCYHVVLDRHVTWSENVSVISGICLMTKHESLNKWFLLQCRKKVLTLRITPKGEKSEPRILYRAGTQDNQIRNYLEYKYNIPKLNENVRVDYKVFKEVR